ncbi:hypothetical protein ACVIGB_003379 [Bradyrhizobium sp. USDA 4341]
MLSFAKHRGTRTGVLAGEYVGASGGVSLGVGVGANPRGIRADASARTVMP